MRDLFKGLIIISVIAVVMIVFFNILLGSYSVLNTSMEPGVQVGEHILINKMAYNFKAPDRGEVVYCKSTEGDSNQLKRIIGLPGDIVEIKDNRVYINNTPLKEPYVKNRPAYTLPSFQVPANNYFVLDDNRNHSVSADTSWTTPREDIKGRAWICAWPPDRWGGVNNYPLDSQLVLAEVP